MSAPAAGLTGLGDARGLDLAGDGFRFGGDATFADDFWFHAATLPQVARVEKWIRRKPSDFCWEGG